MSQATQSQTTTDTLTAPSSQTHTHADYGHSHVGGGLPHNHGADGSTIEAVRAAVTGEAGGAGDEVTSNVLQSEASLENISSDNVALDGAVTQSSADGAVDGFNFPTSLGDVQSLLLSWWDQIVAWLQSPPFLAQIAAIILAIFLAPIVASVLKRNILFFREEPKEGRLLKVRSFLYRCRGFVRTTVLVGLLALFAVILENIDMFGQSSFVKIAQGIAVVALLFNVIKTFISHPLIRRVVTWVVLPIAVLMVFGYYDYVVAKLEATELMELSGSPITALTFVKLAIFGAIIFWLGGISNAKGQSAIRNQQALDVGTREVVAKIFQILLFVFLFILVMSIAGIPLSGLVFVLSFAGLGIGLGLQPVAANFVSGLIILFDRSVQVGDFVVLPDGQEGFVEAINMRSTTVETTDGKDIMVPNTVFIENAYENWTHKDPRQRYEVYFSVEYGTDIDRLEDIIIPAIKSYDKVLDDPEEPDLELREFGDYGIKFAVEFWASGIDDGPNKFTSDLNFIVWRTLKKHGIVMPLPQTEVRMLK